ncbi:Gfo/Idh/MocA family protein [Butyrivibrio sp. VCB2001]|uniref:Gfo/Idh/MocA family protein n=1 Tax=Butyrivibrio sp. VCB2001 TaxID=1280667 RepID=UPI0009DC4185
MKVAIMGTGKIAGTMAETLKETKGVTCYAVGSRTLENAEKFAKDYGFKKAYGSYAELVTDPKVDLIYVATPHSEHYENVKLAISAGRNVICEKAFMLNEKQAKKIFEFAEEKKVLVTEAIWTRYMPMRTKLMEILASNVIGEPTMLTANLSYNIAYKERIQKPELGGGALLDLGVYCLHFASMVFGNDVKDIASICTFNNLGMDMQDSITLRYADGKMAVLNATVLSTGDRNGVIYGSKGFIVVENINNPEAIAVYDNNYNKTAYYKRPKQKTGYEYEIEACVKAIGEGWLECPDIPHAETLKILNMMDFIRNNNHIVFPGENDISEAIETPAESTYEATQVSEIIPETEAEPSEEISEAAEQGEYEEEVNSGDDTSGTDN